MKDPPLSRSGRKLCGELGGVGGSLDGSWARRNQSPACLLVSWTWYVRVRGLRRTEGFSQLREWPLIN